MRRALILAAALVGCGRLGFDDSPRAGDARIPDSAKPDTGPACAGHAGPSSVYILAATPFCIDATEVTNEQYAEFLGANPAVTGQPPECSWKTTYVPGGLWPFPLGSETLPVATLIVLAAVPLVLYRPPSKVKKSVRPTVMNCCGRISMTVASPFVSRP